MALAMSTEAWGEMTSAWGLWYWSESTRRSRNQRSCPRRRASLVAPEVAGGGRDVAQGAEVSAGGRLALHGDGAAGDGLDDRPFVGAVLGWADGAVLEGDQAARGAHSPHPSGEHLRQEAPARQLHRGVGEAAGRVAARDGPAAIAYLGDAL